MARRSRTSPPGSGSSPAPTPATRCHCRSRSHRHQIARCASPCSPSHPAARRTGHRRGDPGGGRRPRRRRPRGGRDHAAVVRAGDRPVGGPAGTRSAFQRELLDAVMGADGRRFLELTDHQFATFDSAGWPALFLDRYRIAREWEEFFTGVDVLLSPTWTAPAFEHGADIASAEGALGVLETIRPVLPANFLGLPAAVAPAGVVEGLPVGAQFTGARFADLTTLAAAAALEAAVGTFTPIDPRPWRPPPSHSVGGIAPAARYRQRDGRRRGGGRVRRRSRRQVRRLRARRPLPAGGRPRVPVGPAGDRPAAGRPAAHRSAQRPEHRGLRLGLSGLAGRHAAGGGQPGGARRCPTCPSSCAPASTRSSPPPP